MTSGTPLPIAARGPGGTLNPAGPFGARPPNAFGLSKTRLVTTSLVLYVLVFCSITGHIAIEEAIASLCFNIGP